MMKEKTTDNMKFAIAGVPCFADTFVQYAKCKNGFVFGMICFACSLSLEWQIRK